jgi:lipopolysaccharide transport system ATP-binding protein
MNDTVIRAEKIDKLFHIGTKQGSYRTFRETVTDAFTAPFRRIGKLLRGQPSGASELDEEVWALKDVSFQIKRGEVVGFIGRNGAGKSTLLKVLSRITEPTNGYAEIYGRVGSLLEVGTGFHPELTGRENIYLNGAILGMKRIEINRKFDEIVAFSEVDKFIDTPVKHYSSGMYLRLAFAVAAHLEPEILIVDEVLAVGDARFQKKCLNKMEDIGKEGRTVLFVSHNMPAVIRLCERAILLDGGTMVADGPTHQIVGAYLRTENNATAERKWSDLNEAPGSDVARLRAVRTRTDDGELAGVFNITKGLSIEMEYEVLKSGYVLIPNFNIYNDNGIWVFTTMDLDPKWRGRPRPRGTYVSVTRIPGNLLAEGTLSVEPAMMTPEPLIGHFRERDTITFQVVDSHNGDSARGDFNGNMEGVVRPLLEWTTQFTPSEREISKMESK